MGAGVGRVAVSVAPGGGVGPPVALLSEAVSLGGLVQVGLVCVLTLLAALGVLAYRFYRDPEREAPDRADAVVSPADGEVIYVRRSERGRLPASTKKGATYDLVELARHRCASATPSSSASP